MEQGHFSLEEQWQSMTRWTGMVSRGACERRWGSMEWMVEVSVSPYSLFCRGLWEGDQHAQALFEFWWQVELGLEGPEDGKTDQSAIALVLGRSDEGLKGEWEQLSSTFNPHTDWSWLIPGDGRDGDSFQSLVFIGLTWGHIISTLHFALPMSQPVYTWTNYLVSLGFLFTSCKTGIIILAINGNCLVGMLYAFVWVLAYSWHEIIVNNIANTSANILQDLQKSQHPPVLNILSMRKHSEVIKGWPYFVKQ